MRVVACFVLVTAFVHVITAVKPKSVNLALETELQFDKKDHSNDVEVINNVQKFLENIKNAISKNNGKNSRRSSYKHKRDLKFTDFIVEAAKILKTYDDDTLGDVFAVIDDESRKFNYKGCKFYELFDNIQLRRFMSNKLEEVKDTPPEVLRKYLDKIVDTIERRDYNQREEDLVEVVNSLYNGASHVLYSILERLSAYNHRAENPHMDLTDIISSAMRSLVFDHYSGLNDNARQYLRTVFNSYWDNFKDMEDNDKKSNFDDGRMGKNIDIQLNVIPISTVEENYARNWDTDIVTKKSIDKLSPTRNVMGKKYYNGVSKLANNKLSNYVRYVADDISKSEDLSSNKMKTNADSKSKKKKTRESNKFKPLSVTTPKDEQQAFLNYIKDTIISDRITGKSEESNINDVKTQKTIPSKMVTRMDTAEIFYSKENVKSSEDTSGAMATFGEFLNKKEIPTTYIPRYKALKTSKKTVKNRMPVTVNESEESISKEKPLNKDDESKISDDTGKLKFLASKETIKEVKTNENTVENLWSALIEKFGIDTNKEDVKTRKTTRKSEKLGKSVPKMRMKTKPKAFDTDKESSEHSSEDNYPKVSNKLSTTKKSGVSITRDSKTGSKKHSSGLDDDSLDGFRTKEENELSAEEPRVEKSTEAESAETGILVGGQKIHDTHYRAQQNFRISTKKPKTVTVTTEKTRTPKIKEINAEHSAVINVKLPIEELKEALRAPSYVKRMMRQDELKPTTRHQHGPYHKAKKSSPLPKSFKSNDKENLRRNERKSFTAFAATISHEGLSIESFENDESEKNYNLRKNRGKITRTDNITEKFVTKDVNKLIHNLEKQLEDVKEQIELVKAIGVTKAIEKLTKKDLSEASDESEKQEFSANPTTSLTTREQVKTTTKPTEDTFEITDSEKVTESNASFTDAISLSTLLTTIATPVLRSRDDDMTTEGENETETSDSTKVTISSEFIEDSRQVSNKTESTTFESKDTLPAESTIDLNINLNITDELPVIEKTTESSPKDEKEQTIPQDEILDLETATLNNNIKTVIQDMLNSTNQNVNTEAPSTSTTFKLLNETDNVNVRDIEGHKDKAQAEEIGRRKISDSLEDPFKDLDDFVR